MNRLSGKYAIVTGGGKGLGAAIAKKFVEEQAEGVAILEYDLALAEKTAREMGGNVLAIKCDVADEEQVKAAVEQVLAAFGRIDILVNNAGIIRDAMFHKMTGDQWHQVINVNLNGTYHCCKYVIPHMREQNYGKIVNLSSVSANGNVGQTNYAASKAAVEGFTKSLAKESGRKGITVNAIAPAGIDTDMQRSIPEANMQRLLSNIPMQRLGSVEELANAALFLASDDSSFVNGIVLPVNGGYKT
ncbi:MAG: SDR family oxidoreductase [Ruminococcaceae bacterium]|nr:SDR family oxidoreductase [Oscillospiraceae bacterium]